MNQTTIEWTEVTWNSTTGCTKVSEGCLNCYAERMSKRLMAMGVWKYRNGFQLTTHEEVINDPMQWNKPKKIFVNSMSDLFHEDVPLEYIQRVFQVMKSCPQHVFQLLTKRSDVLLQYASSLTWTPNIWMGVTVESTKVQHRINDLLLIPSKVKFLSLEPLLTPLFDLNLTGIDWVIVGGESGPGARSIKAEWVLDIKAQCETSQTPFFFKQWGGTHKKVNGSLIEGRHYHETPVNTTHLELLTAEVLI